MQGPGERQRVCYRERDQDPSGVSEKYYTKDVFENAIERNSIKKDSANDAYKYQDYAQPPHELSYVGYGRSGLVIFQLMRHEQPLLGGNPGSQICAVHIRVSLTV